MGAAEPDELTEAEIAAFRDLLLALEKDITATLATPSDAAQTVEVDPSIGRLTRMDALQQQSMAKASRRNLEIRMMHIKSALSSIEDGTYGLCRRCDELIGRRRLTARPESPFCLRCQDAVQPRRT